METSLCATLWIALIGTSPPTAPTVAFWTGAAFTVTGILWVLAHTVAQHPWMALTVAGFACLVLAAISLPQGLLALLPSGLQRVLLGSTIFDVLHDNANMQNKIRRWGRILILLGCAGDIREGEVRTVLDGMDSTFLHDVFRRRIIDWLPDSVQWLLRPLRIKDQIEGPSTLRRAPSSGSIARRSEAHPIAGTLAAGAFVEQAPMTTTEISHILRRKAQHSAKRARPARPSLAVVGFRAFGLRPAMRAMSCIMFRSFQATLFAAVVGTGISAVGWRAVAWAVGRSSPLRLLGSFGFGPLMNLTSAETASLVVAQVSSRAAAVSLLGAGGLLASMNLMRRWSRGDGGGGPVSPLRW